MRNPILPDGTDGTPERVTAVLSALPVRPATEHFRAVDAPYYVGEYAADIRWLRSIGADAGRVLSVVLAVRGLISSTGEAQAIADAVGRPSSYPAGSWCGYCKSDTAALGPVNDAGHAACVDVWACRARARAALERANR